MQNTQVLRRILTGRRIALSLLAALAVTIGAVAAQPAGTADAGSGTGVSGGDTHSGR
jgi:hypothetical protein